jgi:hypothetical protein
MSQLNVNSLKKTLEFVHDRLEADKQTTPCHWKL